MRQRLIRALIAVAVVFVVAFIFADEIFQLLIIPYERAAGSDEQLKLIFTAPQEYFFAQLKIALFTALFIAFPVIASQIYKFVAPGLYKNERAGVSCRSFLQHQSCSLPAPSLVFFVVMPLAMTFFLSMQQSGTDVTTIELLPKSLRISWADHDTVSSPSASFSRCRSSSRFWRGQGW